MKIINAGIALNITMNALRPYIIYYILMDAIEQMALREFPISHETVGLWSQSTRTDLGIKFRQRLFK